MPSQPLFITGAGGYIGRHLVAALERRNYSHLHRLTSDLLQPETYRHALPHGGTVVHFAALTGNRNPRDYFRVNRDGTRVLVEACKQAGIRNFLHVSTIAVKYLDLRRYYYAQSKLEAEHIVAASGLRYTIVRPTMVFGPGAPVLGNLARLASTPVLPWFNKGGAQVQPIDIDDLIAVFVQILEGGDFQGRTLEVGGPDVVRISGLLQQIRHARGKSVWFRIPVPLQMLEAVLGPVLPVTVGQLKALTCDGVAESPAPENSNCLKNILCRSFGTLLRQECTTYSRYLVGSEPTEYVVGQYERFHRHHGDDAPPFDRFLVRAAARGTLMARLAAAYASRFRRNGLLRRKLVLIIGLLESTAPSARVLDTPAVSSPVRAWVGMGLGAMRYAFALAVSILLFGPVSVAYSLRRT